MNGTQFSHSLEGDSVQCPLEGDKCLGGIIKFAVLKGLPIFLFVIAGFQE